MYILNDPLNISYQEPLMKQKEHLECFQLQII